VLGALVLSTVASAAVTNVICVPWQGNPLRQHTALSGTPVQLKAVVKTDNTAVVYYKWIFGDGSESAVSSMSGSTQYNVETTHTYTAAVGTPFTAQLLVDPVDSSMLNAVADNYLLKIEESNLDARVNIAIDRGLWFLYKNKQVSGSYYYWTSYSSYYSSPTSAALQAFQINNHKEINNFAEDPYAEAVQKGLRYIFANRLAVTSIGPQTFGNPENSTPPNNIAIYTNQSESPYETGQVMDAIIASGTPDAIVPVGPANIIGRTYKEIVQDMCDMYAWGQQDNSGVGHGGGWRYGWNYGSSDNSVNAWAAIGMIPAESLWGCVVPAWVKARNYDSWLQYSWNAGWASWGYSYSGDLVNNTAAATRPSGMVQLVMDLGPVACKADPKWIAAEAWFANNWASHMANRSYYGWFAFVKAMRLSNTETLSNGFNWYRGTNGIAEKMLAEIESDGSWVSGSQVTHPYDYGNVFVTGWAIGMLNPALFQSAPIASFTAAPNPTYSDGPIVFDPSSSGHSDPTKSIANLVKFEWDWNHDGTYDEETATPTLVTHSFHAELAELPKTFPVTLRVTDDNVPPLTATYTLDIIISNPPHPPVAMPGGPYIVSDSPLDSLTLDGSGSFDPNEGQFEPGHSPPPPPDTITAWDWDFFPPLTNFTDASGETVVLNAAAVTSTFSAGTNTIGLRVTDNTALSFPSSGKPNLTHAAFGTVTLYPACPTGTLSAAIACHTVMLTWTNAGAYDVLRSTQGPNEGFVKVGQASGTAFADATVVSGTTYWYRLTNGQCLTNTVQITFVFDPNCVGLTCRAKNRKVELVWPPITGATSYNVYRSTTTGGPYVKIGNTTSTYCVYIDLTVTNGVTYFYVIRPCDSTGAELLQSNECSGTPRALTLPPPPATTPTPLSIGSATLSQSWVYQNVASSQNEITLTLTVTPGDFGPEDVAVTVAPVLGAANFSVVATADPLVWKLRGADYALGNTAFGDAKVLVTVTGQGSGGVATKEVAFDVRLLGDTNDDGAIDVADKLEINKALNGMNLLVEKAAVDLNSDGVVNAADKLMINQILNGQVPN